MSCLTTDDREALKTHGFEYAEEFLATMATNSALINTLGLPDDAAKKRVLGAMPATAEARARSFTQHPLIVHIPDLIVAVGVSLVVYALVFLNRGPVGPVMAQQVTVTAPEGLAPFRVIDKSDVEIRLGPKSASAATSVEEVLGRYVTEPLAKGAVIDKPRLNSGRRLSNELDGLRVLGVKLQTSPILVNVTLPVKVGIVPAPRTGDTGRGPKIFEVYILEARLQSDGIAAVVATSEAICAELSSFLGRADLIVVGPAH
jgi:hypothetical protein